MRVVKEAEERREEILDAAEKLFAAKGFDNTSTGDILDAVGIARGTLYYHFKSKEEILDGVIQRLTDRLMQDAGAIVRRKELPVLERLTKAILSLKVESRIGQEIMEQVHRPQNALMHQKMQTALLEGINPILTELVEEGVRQEIAWGHYVIGDDIPGLNRGMVTDYIRYLGNLRWTSLGYEPLYPGCESEPESMAWVSQYSNANMVKTDFFEARSTAYAKSTALVDDL